MSRATLVGVRTSARWLTRYALVGLGVAVVEVLTGWIPAWVLAGMTGAAVGWSVAVVWGYRQAVGDEKKFHAVMAGINEVEDPKEGPGA